MRSFGALALLAAGLVASPAQALPSWFYPRATVCNGFAQNCQKAFSNFTFIGTHDSYAISSYNLAANQDVSVTAQLNAGIRMLQSQAHKSTNSTPTGAGIDLCHTDCDLFQGGSLENYLSQVKAWSDKNPTEVISLLIVNSDSLPATQFAKAFESTGLASKSYRAQDATGGTAKSAWPTLGELIDAGTPLVTFLASYADNSVPYLIAEFSSIWENPYNQLTTPFNCSVDRVYRGYDPSNLMYLSNHFKDTSVFGSTTIIIPDKKNLPTTNSAKQVLADANNCASMHGSWPTFILVDFFNTPSTNGPLTAAAQMNGTPWTSNSTAIPPSSVSNSTSPSGGNSNKTSAAIPSSQAGALTFYTSAALLASAAVASIC
ncbi:hypothetical protein OC846_001580 [Tilletia horrida]|uniref:PLC-like phosphodiesterase n=1 Tax=Tilletia horrida TaxID=155126 RepID=A0AAN6GVQ2_9BASI|nr:hypothetical protein OC845_005568 [Tilletia horrida]KAK0555709.1 hypothetical protein OC846_001580 [Tilletia horrida]KAK0569486.1 hypothetical protein OC861_000859 [Tilletia horrida]